MQQSLKHTGEVSYYFNSENERYNVHDRETGDLIGTIKQRSAFSWRWAAYDTYGGNVTTFERALEKIKEAVNNEDKNHQNRR